MMLRMRHNKYADILAERSPIMATSEFVELNIYINMSIMYYKLGIDSKLWLMCNPRL